MSNNEQQQTQSENNFILPPTLRPLFNALSEGINQGIYSVAAVQKHLVETITQATDDMKDVYRDLYKCIFKSAL